MRNVFICFGLLVFVSSFNQGLASSQSSQPYAWVAPVVTYINLLSNADPAITLPDGSSLDELNDADFFIATVELRGEQNHTVEFSLDGINWFTANQDGEIYTYNFGQLDIGEYSITVRVDGKEYKPVSFSVVSVYSQVPDPVSNINLPLLVEVDTDLVFDWEPVPGSTFYHVYLGSESAVEVSNAEMSTNFDLIGAYDIQVEACNTVGCSEPSPLQNLVIYHTEIDFNNYTIESYGTGNDGNGSYVLTERGRGIQFSGKAWRAISIPKNIGVHTILAFDFVSSEQGKLHAIGMTNDLEHAPEQLFQLSGVDNCCITETKTYAGGDVIQHFEIMIGQHYRGEFSYLVFVTDQDAGASVNADSTFRAVEFFEEQRVPDMATGLSLSSTAGVAETVEISWDPVSEATHYQVIVNDALLETVTNTSTSTSFDTPGNKAFSIQTCNHLGCNLAAETLVTQVLPPPDQVTELALNDAQQNIVAQEFAVVWLNLNNANEYRVYVNDVQHTSTQIPYVALNLSTPGSHNITVQACNQYGCGSHSQSLNVDLLGPPEQAITVIAADEVTVNDSIPVSWNADSAADYYEVTLNDQIFSSPIPSHTEVSFSYAGSYSVSVRACNLAGCGDYATPKAISVRSAPAAVLSIVPPVENKVGQSSVISWPPVDDANYYQVFLNGTALSNVDTPLISVDFVNQGIYQIEVNACNDIGCGPRSAALDIDVAANPGPTASDALLEVTQQIQTVEQDLALLVSDDNGIDWSSIQITNPDLGKVSVNGTKVSIDYAGVHLLGNERLEYIVSDTLGAASNKGYLNLNVSVVQIPALPTELNIVELTPSDQLALSWQAQAGEDIRYHVERQLDDGPWHLIQEASIDLSINIYQPFNGSHRFKVKACRVSLSLCSDFATSDDLVIKNPPHPIENVLVPSIDENGQIRLQWLAAINAQYYNIYQQKDLQGWHKLDEVMGTVLLTQADSNGEFGFRVEACNEFGCSAPYESSVAVVANAPVAPAIAITIDNSLSWSQVDSAIWYLVQSGSGTSWQGVNGNTANFQYADTTLVLEPAPSDSIQIFACNNFGCSDQATVAESAVSTQVPINSFYADQTVLNAVGDETPLFWEVSGVADVFIEVGDVTYTNLPLSGSMVVSPEQSSRYTLNARENSTSVIYKQTIAVAVGENEDIAVSPLASNPAISAIVSSILVEPNGNRTFGDLQGTIYQVDVNDQVLWQQTDVGTLYSPPKIEGDSVYFTATANGGQGRYCSISTAGTSLHCVELGQAVVGGPVIDLTNDRVLVVDLYGSLSVIDLSTDSITPFGQIPGDKLVRSTPVLSEQNTLMVRTTDEKAYMLDLNQAAGTIGWVQSLEGEQP